MKYKASELVGKDAKIYVGVFFDGYLHINGRIFAWMERVEGLIWAHDADGRTLISPDAIVEVEAI